MLKNNYKAILIIIAAACLLAGCQTSVPPTGTKNTDPISTVTSAAGNSENTETQFPTQTESEISDEIDFNSMDQIDNNQYWKEGLPLISVIGKTAEEISEDYRELKFWGWFEGWNYFEDPNSKIYYFFDTMDVNGNSIETLDAEMVCHGFLTELNKLFPSIPDNFGNEPISIDTFGQCLGLSFSKLYPDDEEDHSYFAIISSKNLAVIIYTDELSNLPPDYGISVVEAS